MSSPIDAIICAEFAATGRVSTRSFHGLFAGKIGHARRARQPERLRRPAAEQRGRRSADERDAPHAAGRRTVTLVPFAFAALELDRAAVLVDERARDREAEPGAGNGELARGARAVEAREDVPLLVGRDADPVSATTIDAPAPSSFSTATSHDASVAAELDRVREQVVEHLAESPLVSEDGGHVVVSSSTRTCFSLAAGRTASTARSATVARSIGSRLEVDAVRLDLRDEQEVLDERVQPLGAATDHVEVVRPVSPMPCSSSWSISRKPEIDVSGVRSSCETVATNASRMRSSSLSAVTSRSVQMRPSGRPRRSLTGDV